MKKLTLLFMICMFNIQATFAQNNAHIDTQEIENKVDSLIKPLVDEGILSGSILIAIRGNILFAKGYGLADREHNVSNTLKTIFRIASITKPITAIAIMQLHERNKLNINDPLDKYFHDFPNGDKITLYHLLTHTSGLASYDWRRSKDKPQELEVVINWIKELELKSIPGEKFMYSNSGYAILAYIIEKVSWEKYEDYLKENTFAGEYAIDESSSFTISVEKERIYFQETGQPKCEAYRFAENYIYIKEINSRIRFEKSEDGTIKYTAFLGLFLVTGERIQKN